MAAYVQTSAGFGLIETIRALGGEPRQAFGMAGVEPTEFVDPTRTIALDRFVALLECAARVTDCAEFGLRFAQAYDIRRLGPVGYLIRHGRTLGEALGDYARYFNSLQTGTRVTLETGAGSAAMTYHIDDLDDCERRQDAEFSTAIVVAAAHRICGSAWVCHEVQFEHSRPRGRLARESLLATSMVRFGAVANRIEFPAELLDAVNPEFDPLLVDALRCSLAVMPPLSNKGDDVTGSTRNAVRAAIRAGRSFSIGRIALDLGLSVRQLQRKLTAQGVTFNDLATAVRMALAEAYLLEGGNSMTEIALSLGFSETSAFSRAFKTYTGAPPSAFRRDGSSLKAEAENPRQPKRVWPQSPPSRT